MDKNSILRTFHWLLPIKLSGYFYHWSFSELIWMNSLISVCYDIITYEKNYSRMDVKWFGLFNKFLKGVFGKFYLTWSILKYLVTPIGQLGKQQNVLIKLKSCFCFNAKGVSINTCMASSFNDCRLGWIFPSEKSLTNIENF